MARAYHLVREHAVKYLSILIISMVLMVFASCELQLEQEPNEFFPDANMIPPKSMQIKGNITYDEIEPDIDSFYMQLSPGKYEFSLINLTEDLQLMLYIRDIDTGFVIGGPTRSDNARTVDEVITYTALTIVYAHMQVEGSGDRPPTQTGQYWLKVSEVE